MGEEPDEIRGRIEQTRNEMGETIDALGYKADVAARAKDKVTDTVERARESVAGTSIPSRAQWAVVRRRSRRRRPTARRSQGAREPSGVAQRNPSGSRSVRSRRASLSGWSAVLPRRGQAPRIHGGRRQGARRRSGPGGPRARQAGRQGGRRDRRERRRRQRLAARGRTACDGRGARAGRHGHGVRSEPAVRDECVGGGPPGLRRAHSTRLALERPTSCWVPLRADRFGGTSSQGPRGFDWRVGWHRAMPWNELSCAFSGVCARLAPPAGPFPGCRQPDDPGAATRLHPVWRSQAEMALTRVVNRVTTELS